MIVALTGPKYCGKTTLATQLPMQCVRFAKPLKDALMAIGLTRAHVDGTAADKDTPIPLLGGKTPRFAMKTLGTEWGRMTIDDLLWVNIAMARADPLIAEGSSVVFDDCRFDNEARAVLARGGIVIRIERDGTGGNDSHASEAGVSPEFITHTITNNASIQDAVTKLRKLVTNDVGIAVGSLVKVIRNWRSGAMTYEHLVGQSGTVTEIHDGMNEGWIRLRVGGEEGSAPAQCLELLVNGPL